MKSKISFLVALALIVGAITFSSCRKKDKEPEEEPVDNEQTTADDNNQAENQANDIDAMGAQISEQNTLTTYRPSGEGGASPLPVAPCATITIASKMYTVDFGTSCLCLDGRTRSGKILYDFSGSAPGANYYRNPGFKMSVTTQNYIVDGYQVNIASKTVLNTTPNNIPTGVNPGTNLTWSVNANITITKPNNGGAITWACNRTKELINTNDSLCYRGQSKHIIWSEAHVKLNGSAGGTNARGENYSVVANNLVRQFDCSPDPQRPHRHPFISGTVVYTPGSRPARTIDYGNGSCDLNATLSIKNNSWNISLP